MDAYEIAQDLYRVPGGYGNSGEAYGGILISDSPTMLIGASGGGTFVKNLKEIIHEKQLQSDFRVYLTCCTFEEIKTLDLIRREFPESTFYIHKNIAKFVKEPRKHYLEGRFGKYNTNAVEFMSKKLPKSINNIVEIDKRSSFQAEKTKILVIPFGGPHAGHTFIYSTNQNLLCSGLVGGYSTTDKSLYYLDFTGSIENYKQAFSFLKQAESKIVAPAYDEPIIKENSKVSTFEIEDALEKAKENVFELCSLAPKTIDEIISEFRRYYGFEISTPPYHEIKLDAALIEFHLTQLIKDGKVLTKEGKFRRK